MEFVWFATLTVLAAFGMTRLVRAVSRRRHDTDHVIRYGSPRRGFISDPEGTPIHDDRDHPQGDHRS